MPRDSMIALSALAFSARETKVMSYWPVVFVAVWLTVVYGLANACTLVDDGFSLRTEEVFELGRLAFSLLEIAAEDDLLPVCLSFVLEWRRCDCCGEQADEREWKNVNHFGWCRKGLGIKEAIFESSVSGKSVS